MKTLFKFSLTTLLFMSLLAPQFASAQKFKTDTISKNIFALTNSESGEAQLFIASDKGLVAINSFWSNITAEKFKKEIVKILNRDDFIYTINMVDRLDMLGGNSTYKESTIIGHHEFLKKYKGKEKEVELEIKQLIDMWRWKEEVSLKRLKKHKPGSKKAKNEQKWTKMDKNMQTES